MKHIIYSTLIFIIYIGFGVHSDNGPNQNTANAAGKEKNAVNQWTNKQDTKKKPSITYANEKDIVINDKKDVILKESEHVSIRGESEVISEDSNKILVLENAHLIAKGKTTSKVMNQGNVENHDDSIVTAYNDSKVKAFDNSKVFGFDSAQVTMKNNSVGAVFDKVAATVYDKANIYGFDNSKVTAYNDTQINAYNQTTVYLYDNAKAKLYDKSIGVIFSPRVKWSAYGQDVQVISAMDNDKQDSKDKNNKIPEVDANDIMENPKNIDVKPIAEVQKNNSNISEKSQINFVKGIGDELQNDKEDSKKVKEDFEKDDKDMKDKLLTDKDDDDKAEESNGIIWKYNSYLNLAVLIGFAILI